MKEFYRGGTIANTLNAVPDAIDKMLKENYKKVAIIDVNQVVKEPNSNPCDIRVPLNLYFTPSRIFVKFIFGYQEFGTTKSFIRSNATLDSKYHNSKDFMPYNGIDYKAQSWKEPNFLHIPSGLGASIIELSRYEATVRFKSTNYLTNFNIEIEEIIAIE